MTEIHIPKYVDIALAQPGDIRINPESGPDGQDCHDYRDSRFAALGQHIDALNDGRVVIVEGGIGGNSAFPPGGTFAALAGQRAAAAGMSTAPAYRVHAPGCPPSPRDGGTPNPPCEPQKHCGVTPLGFNTFGDANYPLAGVVVGTIAEGGQVEITSGRAGGFKAAWMFLAARDQAAGFARTLGFLTEATVNRNSQLAGDGLVNRPIPSDAYEDVGPLPLDDWRVFTNTAPNTLFLTFGNPQGAAVTMQFDGVLWGEAISGPGIQI